MVTKYIEERKIDPMNILIIFLIGIAAALFLVGSIDSFNISTSLQTTLIIATGIIYGIVLVAFLWPKKTRTPIEIEPQIIEKEVIKEVTVEKPVIKYIKSKNKEPKLKAVEVPVIKIVKEKGKKDDKKHTHIAVIEVEKKEKKKSKYVGSSYNEKYHLRTCRFAGAIKPKFLIEEDKEKFFKLRAYDPCKVCHPDKH